MLRVGPSALEDTLPQTNACGDETNWSFWLALKGYFACAGQVRDPNDMVTHSNGVGDICTISDLLSSLPASSSLLFEKARQRNDISNVLRFVPSTISVPKHLTRSAVIG